MKNITVATEENIGYYPLLIESCKRNNIELIILGLGKKWTGFTMRFELWLKYLNNLNDNEIVMINDAYDVIIVEDSEIILEKFNKMDKPVIFGNQCGIYECYIKNKKNTLCFGNIIGYVKYIKLIINKLYKSKELWKKFNNDDQLMLNYLYYNDETFKPIIGIDIKNEIFFIASDINRLWNIKYMLYGDINGLYMKNSKLYNENNTTISVLHLPANINGNTYLNYLGYDTSKIKITFENYRIAQIYGIYSYFLIFVIFIIILIIMIYIIMKRRKFI